jgi:hypothetical protein
LPAVQFVVVAVAVDVVEQRQLSPFGVSFPFEEYEAVVEVVEQYLEVVFLRLQ